MQLHRTFNRHRRHLLYHPTLSLDPSLNGVDRLDPNLTINGVTKTPFFRYKLGDADGTDLAPWGYGETLTLQAGTAPSYNQGSPFLGTNDDSCKFNEGGYYKAASNSVLNIGNTEDAVIEAIIKTHNDATSDFIICNSDITDSGWVLYCATGTIFSFKMYDGPEEVTVSGLVRSNWYHIMIIIDRSGSVEIYANTVASGAATDITGVTDTNEPDAAFVIGASSGGILDFDGGVAYCAGWKGAGWLDSHTQTALVKERYNKLCGYNGLFAAGDSEPTAATRTTAAFMEKIENSKRKLYFLGANMVPWRQRNDDNGVEVIGFACEAQVVDKWQHSRDLSSLTAVEAAVHGTKSASPDGSTSMEGVVGDADDEMHGFKRNVTLTAAKWWITGFAKPGDKGWIYVEDATVANATAYFDVSNGAVGTKGAGFNEIIIKGPYAGDSYRFACEVTGTAAAHEIGIYAAHADTDNDYAGDASTANVYFDLVNVIQCDYPPMPIWSKGSDTTKTADVLYWPAGANIGGVGSNKQGTVIFDMLMDNYDIDVDLSLLFISDGGAWANSIYIFLDASAGDKVAAQFQATGGVSRTVTATQAGDIADGQKHTIQLSWKPGHVFIAVDGVTNAIVTTMAAVDIPDDLDRFQSYADKALVTNIRCYPRCILTGSMSS